MRASERGQAARDAFSGPRSRGTSRGREASMRQHRRLSKSVQDTANGTCARTPSHLPRRPGGTPSQSPPPWVAAGRWRCPRPPGGTAANRLSRPSGGTPAQRLSPWVVAGRWWCPRAQAPFAVSWLPAYLDGVDGASRRGPRWCPASVGRRTGAPPPPWGAVAGGPGLRGWTGFARSPGPPALARRMGCVPRRTAPKGRKPPCAPFLMLCDSS